MSTIKEVRDLQSQKYNQYRESDETEKSIKNLKIANLKKCLEENSNNIIKATSITSISMFTSDIKNNLKTNLDLIEENNLNDEVVKYIYDICFYISNNTNTVFNIVSSGYEKRAHIDIIDNIKTCLQLFDIESDFDIIVMNTADDEKLAMLLENENY